MNERLFDLKKMNFLPFCVDCERVVDQTMQTIQLQSSGVPIETIVYECDCSAIYNDDPLPAKWVRPTTVLEHALIRMAILNRNIGESDAEIKRIQFEIEDELLEERNRKKGYESDLKLVRDEISELIPVIWNKGDPKQIHPCLTVTEPTKLDYDEADAIEYCRKHLTPALNLNKSLFETTMRNMPPSARPAFVEVSTGIGIKIKSDLSELLYTPASED